MDGTYNKSHLDMQYSPSRWSTRLCTCKIIEDHFAFVQTESEKARRQIPCQIDVPYGKMSTAEAPEAPPQQETLDIIGTDLPDDAPICFFLHGGFWKALNKKDSAYPAHTLHQLGVKLFAVEYALCPRVTLHTIVAQVRRAFAYTLNYARHHNAKCIHLMGHSAGAHLIAHLLTQFNALKDETEEEAALAARLVSKVILVSGVYDLRPLVHSYVNDAVRMDMEDAKLLSVTLLDRYDSYEKVADKKRWLLNNLKRFHNMEIDIVVAENDSPAFLAQSADLHQCLKDFKVKTRYLCIDAADHFDIMHATADSDNSFLSKIFEPE